MNTIPRVKKKFTIKINEGLWVQRFHRDRYDTTRDERLAGKFTRTVARNHIAKRLEYLQGASLVPVVPGQ